MRRYPTRALDELLDVRFRAPSLDSKSNPSMSPHSRRGSHRLYPIKHTDASITSIASPAGTVRVLLTRADHQPVVTVSAKWARFDRPAFGGKILDRIRRDQQH